MWGTYSIVAADPATGEVGVAVESKYFAVGSVVPWAKADVGAVATQAAGVAGYGPRILALLEAGAAPEHAIREVLADDEARETRQLGVVDTTGRAAGFTGAECNDWAGGLEGPGFAAQGNILAGEAVVRDMAASYERAEGDLAERLMGALEAAEAAGGDRRGKQSAALVVERAGASAGRTGIDRIVDLRVDDHPEPIEELRRLLRLHQGWRALLASHSAYEEQSYERAIELATEAVDALPTDGEALYNRACFASLAGRRDLALSDLRRAVELDPNLLELARRDSDFEPLAEDQDFARLVGR